MLFFSFVLLGNAAGCACEKFGCEKGFNCIDVLELFGYRLYLKGLYECMCMFACV